MDACEENVCIYRDFTCSNSNLEQSMKITVAVNVRGNKIQFV